MEKLLILSEKKDACANFAKYLGGYSGSFEGDQYELVHSYGHIFELKKPQEQVSQDKVARYSNRHNLNSYPWNENDFKWELKLKKGMSKTFNNIKKAAVGKDAIVIATDNDDSGEGDLIGWEIVEALKWNKKVYRIRFEDETKNKFLDALRKKEDVTNKDRQGKYLMSKGRRGFDFVSMQESGLLMTVAESANYTPITQRAGRLKSVILELVYLQTKLRDEYVKKPFYEVKYKDANGNTFARKYVDGESDFRFSEKVDAELDLKNFTPSNVVIDSEVEKRQEPDNLIDITEIGVIVGKQGYSDKEILDTYQGMYQTEHWLSYPRPGENKITQDQFDELLPLADRIAEVVGVDTSLLTHRTARKKYLIKAADHGANRPGSVVPESLAAVRSKYGELGVKLYELVAKRFLAILCEDYVYSQEKAHISNCPEFTATINQPKALNYKKVWNDEENIKDEKFNTIANPYIYEGANPKPSAPTKKFVVNYMKKHKIGTNATLLPTLSDIISGSKRLMDIKSNTYTLNYEGRVQAILCQNTMIASPTITKKLFSGMEQVKELKLDYRKLIASMQTIVKHDIPVIKANTKLLATDKRLQKLALTHKEPKKYPKKFEQKEKVNGLFRGEQISFNREWSGHRFSNEEVQKLLNGEEISFEAKSKKTGNTYTAKGKLKKGKYKGKTIYKFDLNKR